MLFIIQQHLFIRKLSHGFNFVSIFEAVRGTDAEGEEEYRTLVFTI